MNIKIEGSFQAVLCREKSDLSAVLEDLIPELSTFYEESVEKTVRSVEKIGQKFSLHFLMY